MENQDKFIIDFSMLYELSLTIGSSFDLNQTCEQFLNQFLKSELITYSSIWKYQNEQYHLIKATEEQIQTTIIDTSIISSTKFQLISNDHDLFEVVKHHQQIKNGRYVIFPLTDFGFIQFLIKKTFQFSTENRSRLEPLFKKLGIYLNQLEKSSKPEGRNKLQQQVSFSQLVANNLLEGLIITDTENRITFVNKKMCRLTGFKQHELIGKKAHRTLMPPEEWAYIEKRLALKDKTQLRGFLERKGVKKDGVIWWGLICNSPLINPNGQFLGLLMTVLDISKRKNAEAERNKLIKALEESENKYRRVVQNLSEGVIMTDLDDRITFVNQQMCDLTGYAESELMGQQAYKLLLAKVEWQSSEKRLDDRESGISENYIKKHRHKNGSTWWGSINASPLVDENNEVIGSLAAVMNVTNHVEADREREALLEELAKKNKDLDEFTYIVSHDLKAPLRSIKILSEWIYEDYAEVLEEEGQHQMKLLQKRVVRMHTFIESLLEFARLGSSKIPKEVFDLQESVLQIIDSLEPLENFEIKVTSKLPTIKAEKVRIEQVFQNLISNGMKYNDKPKGLIEISHTENKEYYTFKIRDNGIGIEEKYFDKIFQIFQTLEARDTYESTGVGLTIVKKIVESHHGKITLESELKKGTTFIFTMKKHMI